MTAIYVLACWEADMKDDTAEVYRTRDKASSACMRCFRSQDYFCPRGMKKRTPVCLSVSVLERERSDAQKAPEVTG